MINGRQALVDGALDSGLRRAAAAFLGRLFQHASITYVL